MPQNASEMLRYLRMYQKQSETVENLKMSEVKCHIQCYLRAMHMAVNVPRPLKGDYMMLYDTTLI